MNHQLAWSKTTVEEQNLWIAQTMNNEQKHNTLTANGLLLPCLLKPPRLLTQLHPHNHTQINFLRGQTCSVSIIWHALPLEHAHYTPLRTVGGDVNRAIVGCYGYSTCLLFAVLFCKWIMFVCFIYISIEWFVEREQSFADMKSVMWIKGKYWTMI